MRVRSLQTYLVSQRLVNSSPIEELKGLRIGVDAVYWLRTLQNLKDPLADAIGGLPPSVFGVLDHSIDLLEKMKISMVFVFQGMQPPSHMLFSSQLHQQMDDAWRLVAKGEFLQAQHRFALATSRINSDFVFVVSRYLQSKGCETFQAPYFAASQLSYFAQEGVLDAVFGPPALLLFGVPRVITGINFQEKRFEWVELNQLLRAWNVTEEQLVDACLLAGTEYCLTFPYLNLSQFHGGGQQFHFGTAVDFIKQAPLIGYMQHFPNEEMRLDHVDGYCVCKTLIKYPLAFHFDGKLRPVARRPVMSVSGAQLHQEDKQTDKQTTPIIDSINLNHLDSSTITEEMENTHNHTTMSPVPDDFHKIVGLNLPNSIFFLMARRFLSRKLPSVLALGEWWDYSHPTVDSTEYRDLLNEVRDYRRRALGLIAMRLHETFRSKSISFHRYSCQGATPAPTPIECPPDCHVGMSWNFTLDSLLKEMERQKVTRSSFKFCLIWHSNETSHRRQLVASPSSILHHKNESRGQRPLVDITDIRVFEAVVHFMLLENFGYFTPEGGVTVFGSALASTSIEFEEDVLCALELMKCGDLMGEPLEAPPDRPFPTGVSLLRKPDNLPYQRHILLLSRVVSLTPMQLSNTDLWLATVDFDLAAFHSIVKILKKTFRHLSEACVANLLLWDLNALKSIPLKELSPKNPRFPSFMMPRNCMGIIFKHFLVNLHKRVFVIQNALKQEFQISTRSTTRTDSPPGQAPNKPYSPTRKLRRLEMELTKCYSCCKDPVNDLFKAFRFWMEIVRVIELLAQNIDVSILKVDMDEAHHFLLQRIVDTGIYFHPIFQTEAFTLLRQQILPFLQDRSLPSTAPSVPQHTDNAVKQGSPSVPDKVDVNWPIVPTPPSTAVTHSTNNSSSTTIPTTEPVLLQTATTNTGPNVRKLSEKTELSNG